MNLPSYHKLKDKTNQTRESQKIFACFYIVIENKYITMSSLYSPSTQNKNKNQKNNVGQRKEKGRGKRRQGGLTRKFATREGKRVIKIKKRKKREGGK